MTVVTPDLTSRNCGATKSLHFYRGRTAGPGPDRHSDLSEVTQQGSGGAGAQAQRAPRATLGATGSVPGGAGRTGPTADLSLPSCCLRFPRGHPHSPLPLSAPSSGLQPLSWVYVPLCQSPGARGNLLKTPVRILVRRVLPGTVIVHVQGTHGGPATGVSAVAQGQGQPRAAMSCPPFLLAASRSRVSPAPAPAPRSLEVPGEGRPVADTVNHCFPASCWPLLIQVATTHSECLATDSFIPWRRQDEGWCALTCSTS